MPRRNSGPRLWLDKKRDSWTIVDGRWRQRTGFAADEIGRAKKALAEYGAAEHVVKDSPAPFVADVLAAYYTEHLSHKVSAFSTLHDIRHLGLWWGAKRVEEIAATTCRAYMAHRNAPTCARRELAFLNAALKYWHREHGPLKVLPMVTLPPKPAPRTHWITRDEAARFLWHARRMPHIARLFIIGWYSGSRLSVLTGSKWSFVDFRTEIMQRKKPSHVRTNKKAPPFRMGQRLMAHLKRWKRLDGDKVEYIVRYRGEQIKKPGKAWGKIRVAAGLPENVTPHILRHTRATTMLRAGVPHWEVSNFLGMSLDTLIKNYGHHHPDWQKGAADAR